MGQKTCKDYGEGEGGKRRKLKKDEANCDFRDPVDEDLLRVYKLFNVTVTPKMKNSTTGKLRSPFHCLKEWLETMLNLEDICKEDRSLLQFLKDEVSTVGLPEDIINFWGVLYPLRPFFDHSFLEFVTDSNLYDVEEEGPEKAYMELVNGSSILPEAIHDRIKKFGDKFQLVLGADVHRIERKGDGVMVGYRFSRGCTLPESQFKGLPLPLVQTTLRRLRAPFPTQLPQWAKYNIQ